MRAASSALAFLAVITLVAGCATPGGSTQLNSTVYQTHRIVRNLDRNLGRSVNKLNETAAELSTRVEESERQTRTLRGLVEENQVKLEQLQTRLDEFVGTMYRHLNLSPPPESGALSKEAYVDERDIRIEPGGAPSEDPFGELVAPGPEGVAAVPSLQAPSDPVRDYRRARQSYDEGDYESALKQYDEYVEQYPNASYTDDAQFWKAQCFLKLEQFGQAIAEFKKLRATYPTSTKVPAAMYNQASAHLQLGQGSQAVELLEDLVENYPMAAAAEAARSTLKKMQKD